MSWLFNVAGSLVGIENHSNPCLEKLPERIKFFPVSSKK